MPQTSREPWPFVRDQRQQKTGASRSPKLPWRAEQIFHAQMVLLKINTAIAVDLEIHESGGNPFFRAQRCFRRFDLRDDSILPAHAHRFTTRVMPRANFSVSHCARVFGKTARIYRNIWQRSD